MLGCCIVWLFDVYLVVLFCCFGWGVGGHASCPWLGGAGSCFKQSASYLGGSLVGDRILDTFEI